MGKIIRIFLLLTLFMGEVAAMNLRKITSKEGLSCMSVFCLHQDSLGYLWAGTYEGLNMLNGMSIDVFRTGHNGIDQISGDLIEKIHEGPAGVLWIHSNYGFDRYDRKHDKVEYHASINGSYQSAVSPDGIAWVIKTDGYCSYYHRGKRSFLQLPLPGIRYADVLLMAADAGGRLVLVTKDHTRLYQAQEKADGTVILRKTADQVNTHPVNYAAIDNGELFVIDTQYRLYSRQDWIAADRLEHALDSIECRARGRVRAIVRDGSDLIVGFNGHGALRLIGKGRSPSYVVEDLNIRSGVYDIKKDRHQHILWLATDGEGIYRYSADPFSFGLLPVSTNTPVRGICRDAEGRLWIGTKGDGIYCFDDPTDFSTEKHLTTRNSGLNHSMVFNFIPSRWRHLLWVGTEGDGLCYYSYTTRSFHVLRVDGKVHFGRIHEIVETAPNELWAVSNQYGIFRLTLGGTLDAPFVAHCQQFLYDPSVPGSAQFFTMALQDDVLWFSNRENGVYRYDLHTRKLYHLQFGRLRQTPMNDVHMLCADVPGHLFCATSAGLLDIVKKRDGRYHLQRISRKAGLGDDAVRSVLYDGKSSIWACTAHGLLHHNMRTAESSYFTSASGIGVMEFSDGSCYFDPSSGIRYFGGTDGVLTVRLDGMHDTVYCPPIYFQRIRVNEERREISSMLDRNGMLSLRHDQNFFTIDYQAIDYRNEGNYAFEYRIHGLSDDWHSNGHQRSLSFNGLPPGNYMVQLRYRNGHILSPTYELPICVLPPWYLSGWAKAMYGITLLAVLVLLVMSWLRWQRRKRERLMDDLEKKRREDVYESKFQFFTNITHEFSVPLTLIAGPCRRILKSRYADPQIKQYATLIERNSARLNELMQEILEFRRIDTDHRQLEIEQVDVAARLNEAGAVFSMMAAQQHIDYQVHAPQTLPWRTDRSAFMTIVTNLLSNAFKYTPRNGKIDVSLSAEKATLTLSVVNSGRGIPAEELNQVFNRYHIVEMLENRNLGADVARNGLGLAICQGLVRLLGGEISVDSVVGVSTVFCVNLPLRETTSHRQPGQMAPFRHVYPSGLPIVEVCQENRRIRPEWRTIMVIDDNAEMRWFMDDLFAESFNVVAFQRAESALSYLHRCHPDLIVSDVRMQGMDGIELCRQVKGDSATAHIPVILLSSLHDDDIRRDGLAAGADMYINKPYDVDDFHSVVMGLLRRSDVLKDYYETSLSAFDLIEGKVLHKEDRQLIDQMMKTINDHLTHPQLSTQFVASEMGMSVRNLYRRLREITTDTPSTVIKNARMERARQLLAKSELTVEEICEKAGFANRSTFYNIFSARFGCTPRQYRERMVLEARKQMGGAERGKVQNSTEKRNSGEILDQRKKKEES